MFCFYNVAIRDKWLWNTSVRCQVIFLTVFLLFITLPKKIFIRVQVNEILLEQYRIIIEFASSVAIYCNKLKKRMKCYILWSKKYVFKLNYIVYTWCLISSGTVFTFFQSKSKPIRIYKSFKHHLIKILLRRNTCILARRTKRRNKNSCIIQTKIWKLCWIGTVMD